MLEVKVFGGLGNQMFQYAFYRYLLQNNDVVLNISDYLVHRHHQGFELERVFNLSGSHFIREESRIAVHANSVIIRLFQKLLRARIAREAEYYEHKEASFVAAIPFHTDIYFVGFWQDVRYVEPVKADLLKDFSFVELDKRNSDFMNSIADRETVSVHVRRGDYLTSASLGGVCNDEYYFKAIKFIQECVKDPLFVFFSDDIEWCKENFNHIDAKYVDWNSGRSSYRDMQLMSMCKNCIIANSSFSWWGAYLNQNVNIVICPEQWNAAYQLNRLKCETWMAL